MDQPSAEWEASGDGGRDKCSVLSVEKEIGGDSATGNWHSHHVLELKGHCVLFHWPYLRKKLNHRAGTFQKDQHESEITEYCNGDDNLRPVMTQSSSEALGKQGFLCFYRNACLSQAISLKVTTKIQGIND